MRGLHLGVPMSTGPFHLHEVQVLGASDSLIVDGGLSRAVIWRRETHRSLLPEHLQSLKLGQARHLRMPHVHLRLGHLRSNAFLVNALDAVTEDFAVSIVLFALTIHLLPHHCHICCIRVSQSEIRVLYRPRVTINSSYADFLVPHRVIISLVIERIFLHSWQQVLLCARPRTILNRLVGRRVGFVSTSWRLELYGTCLVSILVTATHLKRIVMRVRIGRILKIWRLGVWCESLLARMFAIGWGARLGA